MMLCFVKVRKSDARIRSLFANLVTYTIATIKIASKPHSILIPDLPNQQSHDTPQPVQPQDSLVPMKFSKKEKISLAFSKLSASVTTTIETVNFSRLKRAAIERAKSPEMIQKSGEIVPTIIASQSFQDLCTLLADTPYWNFLDIRMMEAMAAASLIPAAQESVENFKQTFFGMTLSEAAPYFPIIFPKSAHTTMTELLNKDPSKMTIFELHKHRFYLETELLQTGPDTITICRIVIGSVTITWQIHVDHVYKAYHSLKKKQSQLPPQGIVTFSITEAEMYDGLPFVWRGQEIKQIGPIEPLPQKVQQKPIPLPEGLQWVPYDIDRIIKDILHNQMQGSVKELVQWADFHPFNPPMKESMSDSLSDKWAFAVENTTTNKLIGNMQFYLLYARIGKTVLGLTRFFQALNPQFQSQITKPIFIEAIRRANLCGVSQGLVQTPSGNSILKLVATLTRWLFYFNFTPLPHSTKTPGWRAMTSKDVPSALALTNKYTSQFEIGQVFQSEEEFSHYFMCPVMKNHMQAYVVEDPVTGNITDVAGFKLERSLDGRELFAFITIIVPTKSPARQLLIDLLVCAKRAKAESLGTFQFGLPREVFEGVLTLQPTKWYWHLLNYQYNEVDENQVCLFCY